MGSCNSTIGKPKDKRDSLNDNSKGIFQQASRDSDNTAISQKRVLLPKISEEETYYNTK